MVEAKLEKALRSLCGFALSSLAATALHFALGVVKSIVFVRLLGPTGRGLFGLCNSIPSLIVSFGNLGFGLGSLYLASRKRAELQGILGNSIVYVLVQGLLLTALGAALLGFTDLWGTNLSDLQTIRPFVLMAIPLLLAYNLGLDLLTGVKEIHFMNLLSVCFSLLPLAALILLWYVTNDILYSAIISWLATLLLIVFLAFHRLFRKSGSQVHLSIPYFVEAFSFGLRGNISIFANAVVRRIDVLFIAHYQGVEAVGYYAACVSLAEILLALPNAVAMPFLPMRLELERSEGRQFSHIIIKYVLFVMVLVCAVVGLLGRQIVLTLYGSRFLPAVMPLCLLLPGILALSAYQFLKADIYSFNRPGFISLVSVAAMVCNLLLNYLLIPPYGIEGAAVSSSISYGLSSLLLLFFFLVKTGTSPWELLIIRPQDLRLFGHLAGKWLRGKTSNIWAKRREE